MTEKYGYKNLYKIAAITQYLGVVTVNVIGIKMPLSLKKKGAGGKNTREQRFWCRRFFKNQNPSV